MKAFSMFLAGGLGLAAMAASAPAAAQYNQGYPGGGYGGYPGGGNVVSDILGQILGGRSYANNERYAVEQCVRAVEYRINTRGLDNEGGRYRQYGYGQGYNNRYGGGYQGARVTSVTQVSRRSNGGLKVFGYATTGMGGYGNQGYGGGYGNQGYGGGPLRLWRPQPLRLRRPGLWRRRLRRLRRRLCDRRCAVRLHHRPLRPDHRHRRQAQPQ